jgi:hypothetical protein
MAVAPMVVLVDRGRSCSLVLVDRGRRSSLVLVDGANGMGNAGFNNERYDERYDAASNCSIIFIVLAALEKC